MTHANAPVRPVVLTFASHSCTAGVNARMHGFPDRRFSTPCGLSAIDQDHRVSRFVRFPESGLGGGRSASVFRRVSFSVAALRTTRQTAAQVRLCPHLRGRRPRAISGAGQPGSPGRAPPARHARRLPRGRGKRWGLSIEHLVLRALQGLDRPSCGACALFWRTWRTGSGWRRPLAWRSARSMKASWSSPSRARRQPPT